MNVRQMQALAAIYLAKFCRSLTINDESVNLLILHLFSVLKCEDLSGWERAGALLPLNGRGDALPPTLKDYLKDSLLGDFCRFVDCAVEVGIIDLYGVPTSEPENFLNECKGLLIKYKLSIPSGEDIRSLRWGNGHWGSPISDSDYNGLLQKYECDLSCH